ncbi:MAG: 4-(cytidine 5'-diphospho)-2-C-methyl-D-erythritol kinase, partial [Campylobacteraceae bacterium]|nr:4-(cytidine 5'-diphospho)-2-C-methyl-D-erythritol kinase [Campylobacteraceae bacterium]
ILELKLDIKEICSIGSKVGADVNFFLHECKAADVGGVGEIVIPVEDDVPDIELIFTGEFCDTTKVYKVFRENFWDTVDVNFTQKLAKFSSKELLNSFSPIELNDLLRSVLVCYPNLKASAQKRVFLSGSGSTFFKVLDEHDNSKK